MFENLRDEYGMQQRLVVPNFRVEMIAVEQQRSLRQFEILVRANLDGSSERKTALKRYECSQQINCAGILAPCSREVT